MSIPFPNDRSWIGLPFHNQWAIIDAVNSLQLVFSNGGSGKVGA